MNKLFVFGTAFLALCGCSQPSGPSIDLGDMEDYLAFMETRGEDQKFEPFKAEPLIIQAEGKVRAEPDIAVITATIMGEDKNESKAFNAMSEKVNAVQAVLAADKVETGFTSVTSKREFDEKCQNANQLAWKRHNDIQNDYYFNRNLDRRGDKEIKRRVPKPRIAKKVCEAQSIKVGTTMVIRISPAEAAGDALRALADAGAKDAQLFGYDFTDYDAHYQKAAEKAVELARKKAEAHARLTETTLGEIEEFYVTAPAQTSRFGPQPNVIRSARRYRGATGSVVDRQVNRVIPSVTKQVSRRNVSPQPISYMTCWDGSVVSNGGSCPAQPAPMPASGYSGGSDEVVVTGTREAKSGLYSNAPLADYGSAIFQANTVGGAPLGSTTNALSMSLLSGPQTIKVTATLHYGYETPLDGKIIVDEQQN